MLLGSIIGPGRTEDSLFDIVLVAELVDASDVGSSVFPVSALLIRKADDFLAKVRRRHKEDV